MIKLYTVEVVGLDADDDDRTIFTLRTFDANCAVLKMDTLVSPSSIPALCTALQQAVERLELEAAP